ncbi:MAG TPA: SRPBCC domain-containing protein, partial [Verrucomicrobium sp.]|nr:SRPBCC domain-containing protein [Verrucomicrobium sp.]
MSTALDTPAIPVNQAYGLVTEPGTLRIERLLPGPIERVWAYLVEPEKRRRWFADGRLEQKAGGHMELKFRHHELSRPGEEVPEEYRHLKDMPPSPGKFTR